REVLIEIENGAGIEEVGDACDGEEAVHMAIEKKPDIVLMDIVRPRLNGVDATKEILKHLPDVRVIACSTEGHENRMVSSVEAGCCDFISKPYKISDVIKIIKGS